MQDTTELRERDICRVTYFGAWVNAVLTSGKLLAGIFGHSAAMVADAVHSLSDFATDLAVIVFIKVASKPSDESHDFGHGKFETLSAVIIGLALFAVIQAYELLIVAGAAFLVRRARAARPARPAGCPAAQTVPSPLCQSAPGSGGQ